MQMINLKMYYRKDIKYGAAAALFTPLAFTGPRRSEKERLLGRTTTKPQGSYCWISIK